MFMDTILFHTLKNIVFPNLLGEDHKDLKVRFWIPGCSTGEDAYLMTITLLEFLEKNKRNNPIQIFATDINESAIDRARMGIYTCAIEELVSEEHLKKYFNKTNGSYQISSKVREHCVFARHDIVLDPPYSKLDLISCRDLLIYLNPDVHEKVINTFHNSLKPDGILLLGPAETIGSHSDMFTIIDKQFKIFSRKQVFSEPNIDMETDKIIKSKNIDQGEIIKKKTMAEKENQINKLSKELTTVKEYLRQVLKERDAAMEEHRVTLEDLQSVNEELFSMNDELESAKKELNFANQNLSALNKTLQNGNKELNLLNNDLKILLSNIHVPVIMLSGDLRIRHYTPDVEKVFHIMTADIGRPLSDLKMKFGINDLDKILREVIDTLKTRVIDIQLSNNHWYRIKIGPYKTQDYKIGGAILTFHDILYGDKFGIHAEIN